ncbi:MAG: hypothetical protein JSR37_07315 [Verrucomicrobia bacterium]|nr:hypothetical protein [Verrucomicrobiota bacterium]MBS0637418.1 hypothetical protein [Verrucomicrobiota bacterium]
MKIAYSPCPNDTFSLDAWIHGKIASTIKPEPILADIQQLNAWAYQAVHPVTKVSCFTFGKISQKYALLPSGAAICKSGPKIIAKERFSASELSKKRILIPGLDTTAYLLLRTLCPEPKEIGVARYDEIISKILADEADCGLIIHETRFSFEEAGFVEICDLGELFMKHFDCPVPLGVFVAKKEAYKEAAANLKASIQFALDNPESSYDYVRRLSQEKDKHIIQQHIQTYVTKDTLQITEEGMRAIQTLFQLGVEQKLLPIDALHATDHFCYI